MIDAREFRPQFLQDLLGIGEVHTNNGLLHQVTRLVGETSNFGAEIARHLVFQIFGYSEFYSEVSVHVMTRTFFELP